jgi:single-stranded-DNA-specific exonuclease
MQTKTWCFYPEDPRLISTLSHDLGVSEILTRVLINRGIDNKEDAKSFFSPQLSDLIDPFLLSGMDQATERIHKALN